MLKDSASRYWVKSHNIIINGCLVRDELQPVPLAMVNYLCIICHIEGLKEFTLGILRWVTSRGLEEYMKSIGLVS